LQSVPREVPAHPQPLKVPVSNEDNGEQSFNGPLYTLKALSIATALVTLGATASIWGAMKALNARDVRPCNLMTFLSRNQLPSLIDQRVCGTSPPCGAD
jgi:hypothetical protein